MAIMDPTPHITITDSSGNVIPVDRLSIRRDVQTNSTSFIGTFFNDSLTNPVNDTWTLEFDTPTFGPTVSLPEGMTADEATKLLTTCVFCEDEAPGICPTCKEAVKRAREIMIAEWLQELKEFRETDDSA